MNDTLHTYVRDRNGDPIGVVLALRDHKSFSIGWSLTKRSAGDKFDKEMGLFIASQRASSPKIWGQKVPHTVQSSLEKMKDRASRYFKGCTFRSHERQPPE